MTMKELIEEKQGRFILYWFNKENVMVSKECHPQVVDDHTVQLFDRHIPSMSKKSLYCLLFEEQNTDDIFSINKGYISNVNNVLLISDSLDVRVNEKRVFFRHDTSLKIMLMNSRYHDTVEILDMSYNGVRIRTEFLLDKGEDVLLYDPEERTPEYIPATIVYHDGKDIYGLSIKGNYNHICEIVNAGIKDIPG